MITLPRLGKSLLWYDYKARELNVPFQGPSRRWFVRRKMPGGSTRTVPAKNPNATEESDDGPAKKPDEQRSERTRTGDGEQRGRGTGEGDADSGRPVAQADGNTRVSSPSQKEDADSPSASQKTAGRVSASFKVVEKRFRCLERFFRKKKKPLISAFLREMREHIKEMGGQKAIEALGPEKQTTNDQPVQYWGVSSGEDSGWRRVAGFMRDYLASNGVIAVEADISDPSLPLVSSLVKPDRRRPDFKPTKAAFKDKLEESQHLPGLESSEDLGVLMGRKVSHLDDEMISKLDETYGKGKWIVKPYGDEAAQSYGIFFPQRVAALVQEAKNGVALVEQNLEKQGYWLKRTRAGKIVGVFGRDDAFYRVGSSDYNRYVADVAKDWVNLARHLSENINGVKLPEGKYMAQPAFEAVGISEEERAEGKTYHEDNEARVHIVTRSDGSAEVVPFATFPRGRDLPVVFYDDNIKEMEEAVRKAIAALPEKARSGQVYAPDVMKTKDGGYRVVELNPQGDYNGSGYLHDEGLAIDAFTSYLVGREPLHVKFIRNLLTGKKQKADTKSLPSFGSAFPSLGKSLIWYLYKAHERGKPFKGPSGRWFVAREQDGRVVPTKDPNAKEKEKKPKGKKPEVEPQQKPKEPKVSEGDRRNQLREQARQRQQQEEGQQNQRVQSAHAKQDHAERVIEFGNKKGWLRTALTLIQQGRSSNKFVRDLEEAQRSPLDDDEYKVAKDYYRILREDVGGEPGVPHQKLPQKYRELLHGKKPSEHDVPPLIDEDQMENLAEQQKPQQATDDESIDLPGLVEEDVPALAASEEEFENFLQGLDQIMDDPRFEQALEEHRQASEPPKPPSKPQAPNQPASPQGPTTPKPKPGHAHMDPTLSKEGKAYMNTVVQGLRNAKGLSPEQKTEYFDTMQRVVKRFPPKVIEQATKNMAGPPTFYADLDTLYDGMVEDLFSMPEFQELSEDDRQLTREMLQQKKEDGPTAGACVTHNNGKRMHIDGDVPVELERKYGRPGEDPRAEHTYAHELMHIIDGQNDNISSSPEWMKAWETEIKGLGHLTEYASSQPKEGLAELGRLLFAQDLPQDVLEYAQEQMPLCFAVLKKHGIMPNIPAGKSLGRKSTDHEKPLIPELFDSENRIDFEEFGMLGHADVYLVQNHS